MKVWNSIRKCFKAKSLGIGVGLLCVLATQAQVMISPNGAPVAVADAYEVGEDESLVISAPGVLSNDYDADGDSLTAIIVSGTTFATLSFGADGRFRYTPTPSFNGADSFTYSVTDGMSTGTPVKVSIMVIARNDAPVSLPDRYVAEEDTALMVPVLGGILANDSDQEGDSLSAIEVSRPSNGSVSLDESGGFIYTPVNNFNGEDRFEYAASDGSSTGETVAVSLEVMAINDAPSLVEDATSTFEDAVVVVSVLNNDTDIDGDQLTLVDASSADGTATVSGSAVNFTPAKNFNGNASFMYRASDGSVTNSAMVSVDVLAVNDPPAATKDAYSLTEDAVLNIPGSGVLANDYDVDGDALSALLFGDAAKGTLTLNENGSFSYTPAADYFGPDSFSYAPTDGMVTGAAVRVYLTILAANDAPVTSPDQYVTAEDTPMIIPAFRGVLVNDSDIDGDPLMPIQGAGPFHGSLVLNSNGSFNYTPAANYNGTDRFDYMVSDGKATGESVTVSLMIKAVNDAPSVVADTAFTLEDSPVAISVLNNDTDIDGDALTLVGASSANGVAVVSGSRVNFTPAKNFSGNAVVDYRVTDGVITNHSTISVVVKGVNDAPVCFNDSGNVDEDSSITIPVLANDSDADGDVLSITGTSIPVATISGQDVVYTPKADFRGTRTFDYYISDGSAVATGTVTVVVHEVNDIPVAANDTYSLQEDTALDIPASEGVLINDYDAEGSELSAVLLSGVTKGVLSLNANGSFNYVPNADFFGTDSFSYAPSDGIATGEAVTVRIVIRAVNDVPVGMADSFVVNEDQALVSEISVLANDYDADGDQLSVSLVSPPKNGTLSLNSDGTFSYTPAAEFSGSDSFSYAVADGPNAGVTVMVTLIVVAVNDAPVSRADGYSTVEDTPLNISAPGVLANDVDVDGSALSAVYVSGPENGTVGVNKDGSFYYTPITDFCGMDTFMYATTDGAVTGTPVVVTVTVAAVNDTPVSMPNSYNMLEDQVLNVAAPGVLSNDLDADGDRLSAGYISGPANGTVTVNANGSFSYVPSPDFNGVDQFAYATSDGSKTGAPVVVTIIVTGGNDAPVAVVDHVSARSALPVSINVLANDSDPDGDALRLTGVLAHNGTAVVRGANIIYTAPAGFEGKTQFEYYVSDGSMTSTGRVFVSVSPGADVAVELTGPNKGLVGFPMMYALKVTNRGPEVATGIEVQKKFLSNTRFEITAKGASLKNNIITFPVISSLAAGETTNFTIILEPVRAGIFTNVVSATSVSHDSHPDNNNGAQLIGQAFDPSFGVEEGILVTNPQTGLIEQSITVKNTTPLTQNGFMLLVDGLSDHVSVYNAFGKTDGVPFVLLDKVLGPGQSATVRLKYYAKTRDHFDYKLKVKWSDPTVGKKF